MATVQELIADIRQRAKVVDEKKVEDAFVHLRTLLLDAQGADISQTVVAGTGGMTITDLLTKVADTIKLARKAGAQDSGQQYAIVALQRLLST